MAVKTKLHVRASFLQPCGSCTSFNIQQQLLTSLAFADGASAFALLNRVPCVVSVSGIRHCREFAIDGEPSSPANTAEPRPVAKRLLPIQSCGRLATVLRNRSPGIVSFKIQRLCYTFWHRFHMFVVIALSLHSLFKQMLLSFGGLRASC